jgi:hypothetical protein
VLAEGDEVKRLEAWGGGSQHENFSIAEDEGGQVARNTGSLHEVRAAPPTG